VVDCKARQCSQRRLNNNKRRHLQLPSDYFFAFTACSISITATHWPLRDWL